MNKISNTNNIGIKNDSYKTNYSRGFTLVELLAVIAILSLIITIIIYTATNIINEAKDKSYQVTINNIESEAVSYVLEDLASTLWVDISGENKQYQCVTVQNLIDTGYFKSDVLESKVGKDSFGKEIFVNKNNYIYLERDTNTKTVTKDILLVGNRIGYESLCNNFNTDGDITFEVLPSGWSKSKDIIIKYRLYNIKDDVSNYQYNYKYLTKVGNSFVIDKNIDDKTFINAFVTEKVTIDKNGSLVAEIDGIVSKTLDVGKIDNEEPDAVIISTNNVASKQTVTLEMDDNGGSGVKSYYFGKSNPQNNDVEWINVFDSYNGKIEKNTIVDSDGVWYLGVKDLLGNTTVVSKMFYKTILSINTNEATVTPNIIITMSGNEFIVPLAVSKPYYTFNGWYSDSSYSGEQIEKYMPVNNSTLYGKTTENKLTGGKVKITGDAIYGKTLIATIIEDTSPKADEYIYQWYINDTNNTTDGSAISGATENKLTLRGDQFDKYIYVLVTAKKENYRYRVLNDITDSTNNINEKVGKRTITVTAIDDSKVYDGDSLTNNGCTASNLAFEHTVTCKMTDASTITDVGNKNNEIDTVSVYNDLKTGIVNDFYNIIKEKGTLTVSKASCSCNISSVPTLKNPSSLTGKIEYGCNGDGEIIVSSSSNSVISISSILDTSANLNALKTGSSSITVSQASGKNYNECSSASKEIEVKNETYTITYYLGNGTNTAGAKEIGTSTCTYGSSCTLETWSKLGKTFPRSSDNGWKFAGWGTDTTTTSVTYTDGKKFTYNTAGNIKLYAIGSRQFRFYSGIAPTSMLADDTQYWNPYSIDNAYLTSITIPSETAITGWTFLGYRANNVASSTVTITTKGDFKPEYNSYSALTFRSVYKRTLTIKYDGNGNTGGSTSNTTSTQYYNSGYASGGSNSGANESTLSLTLASNKFAKTGYTFSKWADGSTSGTQYAEGASYSWGPAVDNSTVTKKMYAIWNAGTVTVSYSCGTASGTAPSSQTATYGSSFTISAYSGCSQTGYTISGWTTKTDGTDDGYGWTNWSGTWNYGNGQYGISSNKLTLYPIKTANTYTITYYLGNGTSTAGSTKIGTSTCTYGTSCTLSSFSSFKKTFPASTGGSDLWSFYGWGTSNSDKIRDYTDSNKFTYSLTKDLSLYAIGQKTFYFYSGTTPSSISSNQIQYWNPHSTTSSYLSAITLPKAIDISGWTFIGYLGGSDTASSSVTFAASNAGKSVTPAYNSWPYNRSVYSRTLTISYDGNGNTGGSTSNTTSTQYYNSGITSSGKTISKPSFTLATNGFTKTNYKFNKWAEGTSTGGTQYGEGASYSWEPAVGDTTLTKTMYATWITNAASYTITYVSNGGYSSVADSNSNYCTYSGTDVSGTMATTTCTYGQSCSLRANAFKRTCHKFLGWTTYSDTDSTDYTDSIINATDNSNDKFFIDGDSFTYNLSGNMTLYAVWESDHNFTAIGTTLYNAMTNGKASYFNCGNYHSHGYGVYCTKCQMSAAHYNSCYLKGYENREMTQYCVCRANSKSIIYNDSIVVSSANVARYDYNTLDNNNALSIYYSSNLKKYGGTYEGKSSMSKVSSAINICYQHE